MALPGAILNLNSDHHYPSTDDGQVTLDSAGRKGISRFSGLRARMQQGGIG